MGLNFLSVTEIEIHPIVVEYEDWIANQMNHYYGPSHRVVYVAHTDTGLIGLGDGDSRVSPEIVNMRPGWNM